MPNPVYVTYYAEHTEDPSTWGSPRPEFDVEKFNKELAKRAGTVGTLPRFRLRWAGNLDEYIIDEGYKCTGYTWEEDGKTRHVSSLETEFEFPDGAIVAPVFEDVKIFTPRFVIEEFDGDLYYHKSWFVELLEEIGQEHGRHDVRSYYREPAERDIQMCEQLNYLRNTLTDADIAAGIAELNAKEARVKAAEREAMIDQMAEDTVEALTDAPKNPVQFNVSRNFNPQKRIREILETGKL